MSQAIVNQEANVNLPVRRERDFRRFSMSSIRSPVSMALELATALRMLARGTDTLPVLFLRTMGRLQNKIIARIITPGRPAVLSAFRRALRSQVDNSAILSSKPKLLSSKREALSSKSASPISTPHLKSGSRMQRGVASRNCMLKPETKLILGEILA